MAVSRRNLMLWAGGAMVATGAGALAAQIDRAAQTSSSQIRFGVVLDYDQGAISVRLAGGVVADFPYARGYQPIVGETVILAANGSAWVVLDGFAGMPADNPVLNGGFEADGGSTTGWAKVDQAGATTLSLTEPDPAYEGAECAILISNTGSTDTVVYSSPIPVRPGERWTADCAVSTTGTIAGPASVTLMLTWYANDTDVYPTTAAADTEISLQFLPMPQNYWSLLRRPPRPAGAPLQWVPAVPAGTTHMRVAIRCTASATPTPGDFLIDRVVARNMDQLIT